MPADHPRRDSGVAHGRVSSFDSHAGLGEIEADDGRRYPFHCAAVADGTREVDEGAEVSFTVAAGPLGRWEATDIEKP